MEKLDIEQLARLRVARDNPDSPAVPLPTPGDVLYSPPNPDGTMKACGNCMFWDVASRCALVDGELHVSHNCGYHVHGMPRGEDPALRAESQIPQELAGVTLTPTSCATCRHFDHGLSLCRAVRASVDSLMLAPVHRLGCCTRWEGG